MVKQVLLAIIIVALVGGMVFAWIGWTATQQDLDAARNGIYNLQAAVESNASELAAAKDELLTIKAKLEATELYSSTMEKELEATE